MARIMMCSATAPWSSSPRRVIRPGTSPCSSSSPTPETSCCRAISITYPEEITYKKVPVTDPNREQTAKSREMIEEFVKQNHAQLWIQYDYTAGIKRKIAPGYYD